MTPAKRLALVTRFGLAKLRLLHMAPALRLHDMTHETAMRLAASELWGLSLSQFTPAERQILCASISTWGLLQRHHKLNP